MPVLRPARAVGNRAAPRPSVFILRLLIAGLMGSFQLPAQAIRPTRNAPETSKLQAVTATPKTAGDAAHRDCLKCHETHSKSKARRTDNPLVKEQPCAICHQGQAQSGTQSGTQAAPQKAVQLPSQATLRSFHGGNPQAVKGRVYAREVSLGNTKVVIKDDCTACHDAHGRVEGLRSKHAFDTHGQPVGGLPTTWAQVCFGCHAGNQAVALSTSSGDLGPRFTKGSGSSHFIGSRVLDRPDLPSLRGSTFLGRLDCTSCHGNSDSVGAKGPHGSTFPRLLKAAFAHESDLGQLGAGGNGLCYICHSRASIEGNQSFPLHREHLEGFTGPSSKVKGRTTVLQRFDERMSLGLRTPQDARPGRASQPFSGLGMVATCATCHDPHGSVDNPSLIAFDRKVVGPSSVGGVSFNRTGLGSGTCTLNCHGYDHVNARY